MLINERSILDIFCFLFDIFWEQKANDIRWMASATVIEKNNISIKHKYSSIKGLFTYYVIQKRGEGGYAKC